MSLYKNTINSENYHSDILAQVMFNGKSDTRHVISQIQPLGQ